MVIEHLHGESILGCSYSAFRWSKFFFLHDGRKDTNPAVSVQKISKSLTTTKSHEKIASCAAERQNCYHQTSMSSWWNSWLGIKSACLCHYHQRVKHSLYCLLHWRFLTPFITFGNHVRQISVWPLLHCLCVSLLIWRKMRSTVYFRVVNAAASSIYNNGPNYLAVSELYDPLTDQWNMTGNMAIPRIYHK